MIWADYIRQFYPDPPTPGSADHLMVREMTMGLIVLGLLLFAAFGFIFYQRWRRTHGDEPRRVLTEEGDNSEEDSGRRSF